MMKTHCSPVLAIAASRLSLNFPTDADKKHAIHDEKHASHEACAKAYGDCQRPCDRCAKECRKMAAKQPRWAFSRQCLLGIESSVREPRGLEARAHLLLVAFVRGDGICLVSGFLNWHIADPFYFCDCLDRYESISTLREGSTKRPPPWSRFVERLRKSTLLDSPICNGLVIER